MSNAFTRIATTIARDLGRSLLRTAFDRGGTPGRAGHSSHGADRADSGRAGPDGTAGSTYPGDYIGPIRAHYSPSPDGRPDPGEVVWAWIPYEEDHRQGKDRPALVIGRDGDWLLALQVTSQDHDRDREQEARAGRFWMDIGTGPWDSRRRPSEVRLNRVIRLRPTAVRREGAAVDRATFDAVIAGAARHR